MIRSAPFLHAYRALPHWLVNGAALTAARQTHPSWLVQAAVRAWIKKDGIDVTQFEEGPFDSLEHFFLRRLRDGARPLGRGFVSPVDGCVVGSGTIERGTILQVKGQPLSVDRLVNGNRHNVPLSSYEGGRYLTLFLRPRGYHYVHAPIDLTVDDVHWIPGRFFPQNEDALRHIPRIYERNERAVLRVTRKAGASSSEAILVMVGASVVGGIHVRGVDDLRRPSTIPHGGPLQQGDELGHFSFGSTVVVLVPRGATGAPSVSLGQEVLMGETLFHPDRLDA